MAVLLLVTLFLPAPIPHRLDTPCPQRYPERLLVGRPIDRSITDIFVIEYFISREERQAVEEMVLVGEKGVVDSNADGKPESVIFIEADSSSIYSPMLIKVIPGVVRLDAMTGDAEGLWLIDYCVDGTIDRVIEHLDADSAAVARRMVIYYSGFFYGQPGIIVANTRIATSDYQYTQHLDQWQSAFRGKAFIYMYYYNRMGRQLVPINEAPFCFYDLDGNGASEIALRFAITLRSSWLRSHLLIARILLERFGPRDDIWSVRYSFDLDRDATTENPNDYDFSITGIGRL